MHEGLLAPSAVRTMVAVLGSGGSIFVSPMTAWEVGMLVSRGRLPLVPSPLRWLEELQASDVLLAPLTSEILVASSFLPHSKLRDPADKVIAATARECGLRLMTRDKPLLDYGAAGWVETVPC